MFTEHKTKGGPTTRKFTLVEVKYCVDTKPEDLLEKAQAQHTPLLQHLQQTPNTTEELRIILLGAAGYIYNSQTKEQLESLGIQGTALKSLLTNLHVQAIKSLTAIVNIRRHKERRKHFGKLRTKPKKPPD